MDTAFSCDRCVLQCTGSPIGLTGRCGVVKVYSDRTKDKYPWMIADVSVSVIEKIPLYHYKPGSWVINLWVPGCPYNCRPCPWNASTMGEDVGRLYELSKITLSDLMNYMESAKADLINIIGGEPLILGWIYELIKQLHENNIDVTLKSTLTVQESLLERLYNVGAILVDIPLLSGFTPNTKYIVRRTRYLQKRSIHVEVQLSIGSNVAYILKSVDEHLQELDRETPIHIAFTKPLPEKTMMKIIEHVYTSGFVYVYVKDDPSGEYSTTYCPSCGKPVVLRDVYGIRKIILKNNKCPSCGIPIKIIGAERYREQREISRLFATGDRIWKIK